MFCYIPGSATLPTKPVRPPMTASMTAFSRLHRDLPAGRLVWEVRSVNHRYLDVHLKLPENLRAAEPGCRDRINASLGRGRVDAALGFEPAPNPDHGMEVNVPAAEALSRALDAVAGIVPGTAGADPLEFLRWPGVLERTEPDYGSLAESAQELLADALSDLREARLREGARLEALIRERLEGARRIVAELRALLPEIEESLKSRWERRLKELGAEVEPSRIAQEQALLLNRTDVSEELDRLDTHLTEIGRTLDRNEPMGRRLDFLMQELNREANTLGSKSGDLRTTGASVELKVLIDQMREQVQNLE